MRKLGLARMTVEQQTVYVFYDDMVPLGATPTFARITGNLAGLQREAAKVWDRPGTLITFTKSQERRGI